MSQNCQNGSCSTGSSSSSNQGSSCCSQQQCKCCCHQQKGGDSGECDFGAKLLDLADEAWMELLKEKIKAEIASSAGKNLDKLAKLVASTNSERWKMKMAKHQRCEQYKQQLKQCFSPE